MSPVIAGQCGVLTVWGNGLPVARTNKSQKDGWLVPLLVQHAEQNSVCWMCVLLQDDRLSPASYFGID